MANPTRPISPLAARLLGLYLLGSLTLVLLKLSHQPPVAAWSWWGVTALLWAVAPVGAGLGLLLRLARRAK